MAFLLLLAALCVQDGGAQASVPGGKLLYLVARSTAARAEPSHTAREISRLKAFDVVSGTEAVPGWIQIESSTGAAVAGYWLAVDPENVVEGTLDALKYRLAKAEQAGWPDKIRLDVARGRIRRGFTAEQVRLALGDPRSKELAHDQGGPAEQWSYDTMRVTVSMRGVTDIRPLSARPAR